MAEKIVLLGKKGFKRALTIWSGILTFILNLLGCEYTEPMYYSPPVITDFEATGIVSNEVTLLPVKGIEVSVHLTESEDDVNNLEPVGSDITDAQGSFNLDIDDIGSRSFIVYFHDTDPNADGNYQDKYIRVEIPSDEYDYSTTLDTTLSEVDE